jgi:hypothetical protein
MLHLSPMENIFIELEQACKDAGTNLTKVCRAANVPRSTPQRWKDSEPNTIRIYRALKNEIEKSRIEKQNPESTDAC